MSRAATSRCGKMMAVLLIAGAELVFVSPGLCEAAAAVPSESSHRPAVRFNDGLETRVQALTKELDLDMRQQGEIRSLLKQQRGEIQRIWLSGAVPPTERAPATRAANERVGEEIRALLNEAQKKKYNSVQPSTERSPGKSRSVEEWLDGGRAK